MIVHEKEMRLATNTGINDKNEETGQIFSNSLLEALKGKVYSIESALFFLMDFNRLYNEKSERDDRIKTRTWDDIYYTFFTNLGIESDMNNLDMDNKSNKKKTTNKNGSKKKIPKKWGLHTVVSVCKMIKGTTLQDFYDALGSVTYADEKKSKKNPVYKFLKAIESKYINNKYTVTVKKAA